MNRFINTLLGATMVTVIATGANAEGARGELSAWGMGVVVANAYDGGGDCSVGETEFCSDVLGWGAAASAYVPLNGNMSMSTDLFYEYHGESNSQSGSRDEDATYGHLGSHLTNESNPDMPWGGFAFMTSGSNHANGDSAGPVLGFGGEVKVSDYVIQVGGMWLVGDKGRDAGVEDMGFIGVSRDWQMAKGVLKTGFVLGNGDFESSNDTYNKGTWGQFNVFYEAPLGNGNMNWFVGYQGDYVHVYQTFGHDQASFHALKVGITIPLGGGAGAFKTPNFRAPITNADEMSQL